MFTPFVWPETFAAAFLDEMKREDYSSRHLLQRFPTERDLSDGSYNRTARIRSAGSAGGTNGSGGEGRAQKKSPRYTVCGYSQDYVIQEKCSRKYRLTKKRLAQLQAHFDRLAERALHGQSL